LSRAIRIGACQKQRRNTNPGAATSGHLLMRPHANQARDELIVAAHVRRSSTDVEFACAQTLFAAAQMVAA
jgi:hypothetical protein